MQCLPCLSEAVLTESLAENGSLMSVHTLQRLMAVMGLSGCMIV